MIRWTTSQKERLNRAVKNYNAKITRLANSNYEGNLPDKASVRDLRKIISNSANLNAEINRLLRFTRRGSEEILSSGFSRYEANEIRIAKIRVKMNLKNPNLTGDNLLDLQLNAQKALNFNSFTGKKRNDALSMLKALGNPINEDLKAYRYKVNYLKTFKEKFSGFKGNRKIYNELNKLSPQQFYDKLKDNELLKDLTFISDNEFTAESFHNLFSDIDDEDYMDKNRYSYYVKSKRTGKIIRWFETLKEAQEFARQNPDYQVWKV